MTGDKRSYCLPVLAWRDVISHMDTLRDILQTRPVEKSAYIASAFQYADRFNLAIREILRKALRPFQGVGRDGDAKIRAVNGAKKLLIDTWAVQVGDASVFVPFLETVGFPLESLSVLGIESGYSKSDLGDLFHAPMVRNIVNLVLTTETATVMSLVRRFLPRLESLTFDANLFVLPALLEQCQTALETLTSLRVDVGWRSTGHLSIVQVPTQLLRLALNRKDAGTNPMQSYLGVRDATKLTRLSHLSVTGVQPVLPGPGGKACTFPRVTNLEVNLRYLAAATVDFRHVTEYRSNSLYMIAMATSFPFLRIIRLSGTAANSFVRDIERVVLPVRTELLEVELNNWSVETKVHDSMLISHALRVAEGEVILRIVTMADGPGIDTRPDLIKLLQETHPRIKYQMVKRRRQ